MIILYLGLTGFLAFVTGVGDSGNRLMVTLGCGQTYSRYVSVCEA